ncbi:unnamed protein product [Eruca vesicaria subsp. sativa]|uniref:Uncharacterized protein n=1 Tax=Eruca vesicaria subsp. sativa TaxID=29727 RepID=A0ABC8K3M1_ERUVS|nr:unnamed protein product [Eruca vesicaria subsp. sativa]
MDEGLAQVMKTVPLEEDIPVILTEDEDYSAAVRNSRSSIGRLLNPESQNMARMLRTMPKIWKARATTTDSLASDDDRSIAADSWSIKSEYRSTLDDDQRHADAAGSLSSANFRVSSDFSSDKEEPDDGGQSMLGLQSYWDAAYSDELSNFREHGHTGEVWFGDDVM